MTHVSYIIRRPDGSKVRRIAGVKSADEALAKFAKGTGIATLERAKEKGYTAEEVPAETKEEMGKRHDAAYSRWFNGRSGASKVAANIVALSDELDRLANGADDVEYKGVKYRRRGPKNSLSEPGPWRKVTEAADPGSDLGRQQRFDKIMRVIEYRAKAHRTERDELFTDRDRDSVTRNLKNFLAAGWTDQEIIDFVSATEEVNPSLGEEAALRRLGMARKRAEDRLGVRKPGLKEATSIVNRLLA